MSLQIRRGSNAERLTITPLAGEPIWTTDTHILYVGDGITTGGIATGAGGNSSATFATLTVTNALYIGTGEGKGIVPNPADGGATLAQTATQFEQVKIGTGSYPFTLPTSDGTANQVLKTNGAGVVTWSSVAGYAGSQGNAGYTGSQGSTGYVGSTGNTGFVGSKGNVGFTGSTGYTGSAGADGDKYHTTATGSVTLGNSGDGEVVVDDKNVDYSPGQSIILSYDGTHHQHGTVISYEASSGILDFTKDSHTGSGTFNTWEVNLDGAIGIQGYTGSAGTSGDTGYTGSQGNQGVTGYDGSRGSLGYTGSIGFTGSTGFTGSKGDQGYAGSQGDQGYSGSQGIQGYTGSKGDTGFTGSTGSTGFTGSQGVGLEPLASSTSLSYAGSGNITFTVDRSATNSAFGIGTFVGIKANGQAGVMYGTVTAYSGTSMTVALSGNTGSGTYSNWTVTIRGATGYNGSQGSQGYTGSKGFDGSAGGLGYTGSQGKGYATTTADSYTLGSGGGTLTVALGLGYQAGSKAILSYDTSHLAFVTITAYNEFSGSISFTEDRVVGSGSYNSWYLTLTGSLGYTGSKGDLGYSGSRGFTGSQGDQGSTGYNGSRGDTGFVGSQGDLGYTGSTGYTGSRGVDGYTGSQGTTGFTGSHGDLGYTGSQGLAGYTGSLGYVGSQGNAGTPGDTGFVGSQGYDGSQGTTGYTGSRGADGYTGSTGYTGSKGDQGYAGSKGDTGYTGSASTVAGYTGSTGSTGYTGSTGSTGYSGSQGLGYDQLTSTSSVTPGTGSKTWTLAQSQGTNAYAVGAYLRIVAVGQNGGMVGQITAYSGTSLTVNVGGNSIAGGPYTNWTFQIGGVSGFTGSAGTGYTGSAGTGYTGSAGTNGTNGYTGSAGIKGDMGYTGSEGAAGGTGYTGSAGTNGYTGSAGTGYTGSSGSFQPVFVTRASSTLTSTSTGLIFVTDSATDPVSTSTTATNLVAFKDGMPAFWDFNANKWAYVGLDVAITVPGGGGGGGPPITSGLIGQYDTTSFSGSTWSDLSGNGNHGVATGSITKANGGIHGTSKSFDVLSGGSGAYIEFPSGILPSTYTLFHIGRNPGGCGWTVARGTYGSGTWLSGYFSDVTGVAYHEGWVGLAGTPDQFGNNFFICADQNYFFRANGKTATQGTSGGGATCNYLAINYVVPGNWVMAEVLVYNRTLDSGEISTMESYLADKYGITLG
jgi:hypothetical protein